jgi:hypothetical protein
VRNGPARHHFHDALLVATAQILGHGVLTRRDGVFGPWIKVSDGDDLLNDDGGASGQTASRRTSTNGMSASIGSVGPPSGIDFHRERVKTRTLPSDNGLRLNDRQSVQHAQAFDRGLAKIKRSKLLKASRFGAFHPTR